MFTVITGFGHSALQNRAYYGISGLDFISTVKENLTNALQVMCQVVTLILFWKQLFKN